MQLFNTNQQTQKKAVVNLTKFSLIIMLVLALFSCSKEDDGNISGNSIVGTWQFAGGKEYFQPNGGVKTVVDTDPADPDETVEFKSDGKFTGKSGSDVITGTYKISGSSISLIYDDSDNDPVTSTIAKLDANNLSVETTLTNEKNDDGVTGTLFIESHYTRK